jgi:acyl dehydratase
MDDYQGVKRYKGIRLGQKRSTGRIFTNEDLQAYIALTGDTNPSHKDKDGTDQDSLDAPAIPGSLIGGMFSYLLGTKLPGRGTNWLKQQFRYFAPAYPGEELVAEVEILRLRPEKELVNLRTTCKNPGDHFVCQGEALVLVRDLEHEI